jgi:hypothetical protein
MSEPTAADPLGKGATSQPTKEPTPPQPDPQQPTADPNGKGAT